MERKLLYIDARRKEWYNNNKQQREDIKMKQFRCVFDVYYDTGAGGIYDDNGGGYVGRTELTVPAADTGSARELIEKQYKGYRIKWISSEPV